MGRPGGTQSVGGFSAKLWLAPPPRGTLWSVRFLWGAFAAQEFHTDVPLAFGLRGVSSLLLFDGSRSELRDGTASRFRTSSLAQRLEPPARVSILSGTSARSGAGSTGGFSHGVVLCVPSLAKSARLFSASLGRCLRCSGH